MKLYELLQAFSEREAQLSRVIAQYEVSALFPSTQLDRPETDPPELFSDARRSSHRRAQRGLERTDLPTPRARAPHGRSQAVPHSRPATYTPLPLTLQEVRPAPPPRHALRSIDASDDDPRRLHDRRPDITLDVPTDPPPSATDARTCQGARLEAELLEERDPRWSGSARQEESRVA